MINLGMDGDYSFVLFTVLFFVLEMWQCPRNVDKMVVVMIFG